jgi:hypothetical protein
MAIFKMVVKEEFDQAVALCPWGQCAAKANKKATISFGQEDTGLARSAKPENVKNAQTMALRK